MLAALAQETVYVSHKSIKFSPWMSTEDGRDTTSCYAWSKFNCTRGDACRFTHDGPGACVKVSESYRGRKFQCMSFQKKGKCSKGEYVYLHTYVPT